jgi:hypothetical protein
VVVVSLFARTLTEITSAITLNIAFTSDLLVYETSGGLAFGVLILGGNSFELATPIGTGFLVDSTDGFTVPFLFAIFLILSGAFLTWPLVKRPSRPKTLVKKLF